MGRKVDPAKIERAKALQTAGLSFEEIAARLGVHSSTVTRWLVPGAKEAWYAYLKNRNQDPKHICKKALAYANRAALEKGHAPCTATVAELLATRTENCDLCGVNHDRLSRELHMDHCHETGKFRGWLCVNCNLGLGYLKDDVALLHKAIDYLQK